jgi:hypothetical protein
MNGIGWPLLLTATIRPQQIRFLAIQDPLTRFRQYAYALTWWCRSQHASPVVLVDNSLSDDYGKRLESVAESEGCEFEFLTFQGDDGASGVSKAFGDGQCIDYALSHSKTLSSASGFYKCTGRTAVTNLADFERANLGRKNAFAVLGMGQPTGPTDLLNTVFFRCETAWFGHHLRHAYHNANDSIEGTLESVYFKVARHVLTEFSPVEPCIMGRSGALGIPYGGGDFPQDFRDAVDSHLDLT